jgi:hypothetical protein
MQVKQEAEQMKKHKRRGQSLVETALVLPILIIILTGMFEIGRAFLFLIATENAAAEGAFYGGTNPACLADDHADTICMYTVEGDSVATEMVYARVREEGQPLINLSESDIVVEIEDESTGTVICTFPSCTYSDIVKDRVLRVQVTATFEPITPLGTLLWGDTAEVTASARHKILSPPPDGYND